MIQIISDLKNLSALSNEWDSLAEKSATPLLSFAWIYNCAKFLYNEEDIKIITYRENDDLKCILPLVRIKNNTTYYELIGSSKLYEPSGAISEDEESFLKLLRNKNILKFTTYLQRIPLNFYNVKFTNLMVLKRPASNSSYINISSDWNNFYNSLKSGRKSDHRRALKKAKNSGALKTETIIPDEPEFESLFTEAMKIEASSWKGENKSALFYNKSLQNFFRAYLLEMCRTNQLRMAFLSLNDDRIAMLIGVVAFSKFWILKIGYKEEFSSFSPGMLLTMETIKYAFDNNLESYEFLGSYESWQDMWPVEIRHYASLMLIPYNLNSLLHFGYTLIGFLKRKINW